ncbi:MAG: hypothetical protein FVQ77_01980 [Cytophagales bacterium]|nr:hypothetical protein [Cytophagales bacterium]
MNTKKLLLFALAMSFGWIAQSQNTAPIKENGTTVYVADLTKKFVIGDSINAKSMLRVKGIPVAQDSMPGSGQGHGQGGGIGLIKEFSYVLLDREGNFFQSKEKFVPGGPSGFAGPPVFAGAGGACIAGNAWRESPSDVKKLFLCNKYHFLGIRTQNPEKSLHIVSVHSKGVPGDISSHQGMRLEHIYKDFDLNLTAVSKWDLEPFVDPITFEKKFHLGMPGNPFFTINENGYAGIRETDPKTSLSITPSDLGAKITLWDGGSLTDHYGFGISNKAIGEPVPILIIRKLNYHIGDVLGAHVFYAGGKNGDGVELMRIKGNGQIGIGENLVVPIGFRFGVSGSGYFSDKLAVGTTTAQNILHLHRQGETPVYAYFTNEHTEITGNGQGFRIGMSAFGHAELRSHHPEGAIKFYTTDASDNFTEKMRITDDGRVGIEETNPQAKLHIKVNNDNDIAFAVYKGSTENFRITGDGRFFARSYRIKLGSFPDYVFSDSYKRMTFAQKALYFKKYRHLPGLEPAEKIVEDGLDVGNTLVGLTTNVEENSLDIIDMDKRVLTLEKENQELHEENDLLKKRNKKVKIIKIGFIEIRF